VGADVRVRGLSPNPEKRPLISAICSLAAQEADLTDHHGIRITSGGKRPPVSSRGLARD